MSEICGDVPLRRRERTAYTLSALRDWDRARHERMPHLLHYHIERPLSGSDLSSSPLRVYTDHVLEDAVDRYCPLVGHILDVGCGSGSHAVIFDKRGIEGTYLGVDIKGHPNWSGLQSHVDTGLRKHFVQMRAEDIGGLATAFNFGLTVTALEHIQDDARFAKGLFRVMRPGAYSIHIVPGPWSFFLYGYHGWRRYSTMRLVDLFEQAGFQVTELYALGGLASFLLHAIWISWLETCGVYQILSLGYLPLQIRRLGISGMRRQGFLRLYARLLGFAVRMDRRYVNPAHGYAIVIRQPE